MCSIVSLAGIWRFLRCYKKHNSCLMFNIIFEFAHHLTHWWKFGDFLSNNIAVDPNVVCHFSGKPSTTRLSVAKYLFGTRFRDSMLEVMLLMPVVKLNKFYSTRPIATFTSECCEVSLFLRFHFVRKKRIQLP